MQYINQILSYKHKIKINFIHIDKLEDVQPFLYTEVLLIKLKAEIPTDQYVESEWKHFDKEIYDQYVKVRWEAKNYFFTPELFKTISCSSYKLSRVDHALTKEFLKLEKHVPNEYLSLYDPKRSTKRSIVHQIKEVCQSSKDSPYHCIKEQLDVEESDKWVSKDKIMVRSILFGDQCFNKNNIDIMFHMYKIQKFQHELIHQYIIKYDIRSWFYLSSSKVLIPLNKDGNMECYFYNHILPKKYHVDLVPIYDSNILSKLVLYNGELQYDAIKEYLKLDTLPTNILTYLEKKMCIKL
jgi:hypothetical protein